MNDVRTEKKEFFWAYFLYRKLIEHFKAMKIQTLICLVLCFCSCHRDVLLQEALNLSGDNRQELESVLEHYKDDKEKQRAARFLICNMVYHASYTDVVYSPEGEPYAFELDKDVRLKIDSLKEKGYAIRTDVKEDITNIKADYLIENIDLAFLAWKKPWAKGLSFDDFCRYILPYRSEEHPLSNLRRKLFEQYMPYLDSLRLANPVEACDAVNRRLIGNYTFVTVLPFGITNEQVDRYRVTNCSSMSSYATCLMRALGIPVSQEFTVWTKVGNGHSWCAVMDEKGYWHPFAPAEMLTDAYTEHLTKGTSLPAKVYRSVFEPVFSEQNLPDDHYDTFLRNELYADVTAGYPTPTTAVSVPIEKEYPEAECYAYLCAYNMGEWKEIALGACRNGRCTIKNVVGDNVFRLAVAKYGSLQYVTDPFYTDGKGRISYFSSDTTRMKEITLPKNRFYARFRHWAGYWDLKSHSFRRIPIKAETDSTLTCRFPENALMVTGNRWVHWQQRVFLTRNDSVYKY